MTHLDVFDTVMTMKNQGLMVQTPEQYLDIFKCLRDVLTRVETGYYDLDQMKNSSDRDDEEEDVYDEDNYNYDQRGEEHHYD